LQPKLSPRWARSTTFLPAFQFRERHQRRIAASPARACAELRDVDLARSPLIGPLFAIRGLPARARAVRLAGRVPRTVRRRRSAATPAASVISSTRPSSRCAPMPGRGLVVGAVGAFWRNSAAASRASRRGDFRDDRTPGCARLAWMFDFTPLEGGAACLAVTETRIDCNDAAARRAMRLYWLAIRPASGLIRREMLRLLALRCSDPHPPR
jgi:hypothetical protein